MNEKIYQTRGMTHFASRCLCLKPGIVLMMINHRVEEHTTYTLTFPEVWNKN